MVLGLIDSNGLPHAREELTSPQYVHDQAIWWGWPEPWLKSMLPEVRERQSDVGVTELINDPLQSRLRAEVDVYVDPRDGTWAVWGNAVHALLEQATPPEQAEVPLRVMVEDVKVGGRADYIEGSTLWDWKTSSAYSACHIRRSGLDGGKPEWARQLRLTSALANRLGFNITQAGIGLMCRDWANSKVHTRDYPPSERELYLLDIDREACDVELVSAVRDWKARKAVPIESLPECDTWGRNKQGQPTRCAKYCDVRTVCPFGKLVQR